MSTNFYEETRVTARKPHKCEECRGTIQKGESHIRYFCVFDGSPSSGRRCADCEPIFARLNERNWDGEIGVAFGQLWEAVFEGGEIKDMEEFIIAADKRGGWIEPWMRQQLASAKGENPK